MKNIAINTKEVGIISGRDAIYLNLEQNDFKTMELSFVGDLTTELLSKNNFDSEFVPYKLIFNRVLYYECCELDTYKNEKYLASSFDMVEDSTLLFKLKNDRKSSKISENHKHFVLQTYDFVYDIVATDYKLETLSSGK